MGGTIPMQVLLGCIEKLPVQEREGRKAEGEREVTEEERKLVFINNLSQWFLLQVTALASLPHGL